MAIKRIALLILFSGFLSSCAAHDRAALSIQGGLTISEYTVDDVNHLPRVLFNLIPADRTSFRENRSHGMLAQGLAMSGREDLIEIYYNPAALYPRECVQGPSGDPSQAILNAAENSRILILNEAHSQPYHREFTHSLLKRLHRDGYDYFAAETFSSDIDSKTVKETISVKDGTFVADPVFALMASEALAMGYKLASYEYVPPQYSIEASQEERLAQAQLRERGQAENILQNIIKREPETKVVMHVGYSHGAEEQRGDLMPMGMILKEITGVDPVTVTQTACSSATRSTYLAEPEPPGAYDFSVAHPKADYIDGRPSWRYRAGWRAMNPPAELVSTSARVLIEARRLNDGDDAVPLDRVLLWPGENIPLILPPGKYRLQSFVEGGEKRELVVEIHG